MRITLAQIEAFFWTARLGTVREAAERLCITQPSLSLRLREMEKTLGVKLFLKRGRTLQLSPHGRAWLEKAQEVLRLCGEIESLSASEGETTQIIRLGVVDIFATITLSDLLARIEESHPDLSFEIYAGFSQVLSAMLDRGQLDLALLTDPQPDPRQEQQPLASIELSWMISPDREFPDRVLTPADLRDVPIYTNPEPSLLHQSIHRWFQSAGLWPARVNSCNTLAVMAQLAMRRRGATLLPTALHQVDEWTRRLVPVPAWPPIEPHRLFAVWPKGPGLNGIPAVVEAARNLILESGHYRPDPIMAGQRSRPD